MGASGILICVLEGLEYSGDMESPRPHQYEVWRWAGTSQSWNSHLQVVYAMRQASCSFAGPEKPVGREFNLRVRRETGPLMRLVLRLDKQVNR